MDSGVWCKKVGLLARTRRNEQMKLLAVPSCSNIQSEETPHCAYVQSCEQVCESVVALTARQHSYIISGAWAWPLASLAIVGQWAAIGL